MKNESKTVIEWLNEAKEQGYEWADAAIYNVKNVEWAWGQLDRLHNFPCLSDAVGAFLWEKTTEGDVFWSTIYDYLTERGL